MLCEFEKHYLNPIEFYNACVNSHYTVDLREREKYLESSVVNSSNLPPSDIGDLKKFQKFLKKLRKRHIYDFYSRMFLAINLYGEKENVELFISTYKKFPTNECKKCTFNVLSSSSYEEFFTQCHLVCSPKNELEEDTRSVVRSFLANHIVGDFLFLGNLEAARNEEMLNHFGIDYIVNASNCGSNHFENKKKYLSVNIYDFSTVNITEHFESSNDFIHQCRTEGKKCLVHCMAGISRSSTLVLAYLMKHEKMKLKDAFELTRKSRPIISPNQGFVKQLIEYEKSLFGSTSVDLSYFDDFFY